mgnify:CR=1 FL=1
MVEMLAVHPAKVFADAAAWTAHLPGLGIERLAVITPEPGHFRCQRCQCGSDLVLTLAAARAEPRGNMPEELVADPSMPAMCGMRTSTSVT